MRDPDAFDAFYKDARERLLLQTFALTGDLGASRSAVRDAFVVAWHHWRKLARRDDPEVSVRPYAWRQAQRRHTARVWHREKGIDQEAGDTLEALGALSVDQRRALLMTQLASVSMTEMAREIGLPLDTAQRELQAATSQLALLRGVPSSSIRVLFEPLAAAAASGGHWPRPTIIRRAGASRRRTHTTVGAIAAVAALLVSGSLVTDAAGVRPTLDRTPSASASAPEETVDPEPVVATLSKDQMLTATEVKAEFPQRRWRVGRTGDNSGGNGLAFPCQQQRYADPRGDAALVRTFAAASGKQQTKLSAIQMTEASASKRAARRAFDTTLDWYAGCVDSRVQLLATREVESVGEQATQVVLRAWDRPVTTMVVGVARTGRFTTTTMTMQQGTARPPADASARILASAIVGLCRLPHAGRCAADDPVASTVKPLPVDKAPALLSEIDLPPVSRVSRPWVGTEPRRATDNVASTRCDDAVFEGAFRGARISNSATRSYLIPEADLPVEFGLTETVGSLREPQAVAFVEQVRARLAACPDKDLGTDVVRVDTIDERDDDLTVWQLTTELSDNRSLRYFMAILRTGSSVAQLQFIPAPDVQMAKGAFSALARRALDRLGELPAPRGGR